MDISGSGEMMSDAMALSDSMDGTMNGNTPTLVPPIPLDEKQFDHISQLLPTSSERSVFTFLF